jgi:RsiW-degrading membrane proteinase PrsW (M82 family)
MNSVWVALGVGSVLPIVVLRSLDLRSPTNLVLQRLLLGALTIMPAVLLEEELKNIVVTEGMDRQIADLVKAFLVYGLPEEVLRFLAVDYAVRQSQQQEATAVIVQGAWISLGFAIVENAEYVLSVPALSAISVGILRFMLPTAMHIMCGTVLCAGYLKLLGRTPLFSLVLAWGFHGTYDWLSPPKSIGLLIVGFITSAALIRLARVIDARRRQL